MLSDTACKNAHRGDKAKLGKAFKLYDEKGLSLLLKPGAKGWSKWWRLSYPIDGKEKTLSLGVYPDVSLELARQRRDDARKLLAQGINPSSNRKAARQAKKESLANSFEVIAREWGNKNVTDWGNKTNRIKRRLELNIFPWLGDKPITKISATDILACLTCIEERGAVETAHRTKQVVGQVFRYAVSTGRAERDITPDLNGSLPKANGSHFSAMTEPKQVAGLLRAIDGFNGTYTVKAALQLAPLVFVRPGELRHAEWAHIDLIAAEWRYLVTKTDTQHIVPLSRQAIEILTNLKPLRYVFPSARTPNGDRSMSDVALLAALRRKGV